MASVKKHSRVIKKGIDIFLLAVMAVLLLAFLQVLYNLVLSAIINNINPEVRTISLVIFFSIIAVWGVVNLVVFNMIDTKKFRHYLWINITLLLMALALFVGLFVVSSTLGTPNLDLVLRNTDNYEVLGNISCKDSSGKLLLDNQVTCSITPALSNVSATVIFRVDNGSEIKHDFSNLSFTPPPSTNYISFEIHGVNQYNKTMNLIVGYPFTFYTKEEAGKRNNDYITYIVYIFGVLFAIPAMMNNLKNLSKR